MDFSGIEHGMFIYIVSHSVLQKFFLFVCVFLRNQHLSSFDEVSKKDISHNLERLKVLLTFSTIYLSLDIIQLNQYIAADRMQKQIRKTSCLLKSQALERFANI